VLALYNHSLFSDLCRGHTAYASCAIVVIANLHAIEAAKSFIASLEEDDFSLKEFRNNYKAD
jgi:hypothetical protein